MKKKHSLYQIEWSALLVIVGICIFFILAIVITLAVPNYMDKSWVSPSSPYQKQMYENADHAIYISTHLNEENPDTLSVYHLKEGDTLLAFQETDSIRIVAPTHLQKYVTTFGEKTLKLTSDLLLLRVPETHDDFDAIAASETIKASLSNTQETDELLDDLDLFEPENTIYELYKFDGPEVIAMRDSKKITEDWADSDYVILDTEPRQEFHESQGVWYVNNPTAYRDNSTNDTIITNTKQLKEQSHRFYSRHELIRSGETIYAHEGCWYCHTDQTRTLIQDVILTGTKEYPAPPSAANEYVYEEISFTGTRRIGPDLSRVGIQQSSRDWHKSHFWEPESMSPGSIMPVFKHFFTSKTDARGRKVRGFSNYRFEAVYQYLMTKGTRITAPTEAWWKGEDPVQTKEIIEGKKSLP